MKLDSGAETAASEVLSDDASARHFALASLMGTASARTEAAAVAVFCEATEQGGGLRPVGTWRLSSNTPVTWTAAAPWEEEARPASV